MENVLTYGNKEELKANQIYVHNTQVLLLTKEL